MRISQLSGRLLIPSVGCFVGEAVGSEVSVTLSNSVEGAEEHLTQVTKYLFFTLPFTFTTFPLNQTPLVAATGLCASTWLS